MKNLTIVWLVFFSFNGFPQDNQSMQYKEVAVFIGLECPISQKYIHRLNDIYKKYINRSSLKWSFIVAGDVKEKEIKKFIKEYDVRFPIESDDSELHRTAYFEASVTPEVIIKQGDKTLYRGAIDNWFYELGRYRAQTTEQYLIDALDAILKNQEPLIKKTKAFGCFIEKSATLNPHHQHD